MPERSEAPRAHAEPPPAEPQATEPAPGKATAFNLLEQVLQQTARQAVCQEEVPEMVRQALRSVAERHRGQAFDLDPVAIDLVHASLSGQFALVGAAGRDWRPVSARIARVLWDDPAAHERLRTLWEQLSGPT